MTSSPSATIASVLPLRLRSRDSSRANGTVKWNSTMASATQPKPPWMRGRKKAISSGRLPAQVIRNCDQEK